MKTVFRPRWPRQELAIKLNLRRFVNGAAPEPPAGVALVTTKLATIKFKHILSR